MNNNIIDKIKEIKKAQNEISVREIINDKNEFYILYLNQITDKSNLADNVIKPLVQNIEKKILTIEEVKNNIIFAVEILIKDNEDEIIGYVREGFSVIISSKEKKYLAVDLHKVEKRGIQQPELDTTLRGPKDSFTENFDDNLSLICYRIKDKNLKIDDFTVGERTKTKLALIYIKDIANPKYINEVKNRIKEIDIDGVFESGYVSRLMLKGQNKLFPLVGIVERSELACQNIIQGKMIILVEGSNLALVLPKTFIEFFDAGEDHYGSSYFAVFSKLLRILAILISLTSSAFYIAIVSFHPSVLPAKYILSIAMSRGRVPFNALLEDMLMGLVAEILREGSIRLPKQIGPAIGIVGTIVIGQAAVSAGLVSPLMVIIVSLSILCSFVVPDYTIMNSFRILKFLMMALTGIFGLFGFVVGITFITLNLCSLTSFGVPYVAPLSPFNGTDLKNFMYSDIVKDNKRPEYLNTIDKTRQKKKN